MWTVTVQTQVHVPVCVPVYGTVSVQRFSVREKTPAVRPLQYDPAPQPSQFPTRRLTGY